MGARPLLLPAAVKGGINLGSQLCKAKYKEHGGSDSCKHRGYLAKAELCCNFIFMI